MTPTETIGLACDASSLIILYKSGALVHLSAICRLYTSARIFAELKPKATPEELRFYKKQLRIVPVDITLSADDSLFHVYQQENCLAILSDDAPVLKKCEQNLIHFFSAISILPFLHGKGLLSHKTTLTTMALVKQHGRYSTRVLAVADEMLAIACRSHQ